MFGVDWCGWQSRDVSLSISDLRGVARMLHSLGATQAGVACQGEGT
jgi:hypothetical protein